MVLASASRAVSVTWAGIPYTAKTNFQLDLDHERVTCSKCGEKTGIIAKTCVLSLEPIYASVNTLVGIKSKVQKENPILCENCDAEVLAADGVPVICSS